MVIILHNNCSIIRNNITQIFFSCHNVILSYFTFWHILEISIAAKYSLVSFLITMPWPMMLSLVLQVEYEGHSEQDGARWGSCDSLSAQSEALDAVRGVCPDVHHILSQIRSHQQYSLLHNASLLYVHTHIPPYKNQRGEGIFMMHPCYLIDWCLRHQSSTILNIIKSMR